MLPPPRVDTGHSWLRFALGCSLCLFLVFSATAPAWGALAIDQVQSTDRSRTNGSITSPSFSTTAANELLLAFISTDSRSNGATVTGVSGAGLTWTLVRRTNAQAGDAEVWRAFAPAALSSVTVRATLSQSVAASITVVSFVGADSTSNDGSSAIGATASASAPFGAPSGSLVTTLNGSWVFGVGNDWDNAKSRTVPAGQTMVHQYLASVQDTYWVQGQGAPTPLSGSTVTINDTAPTGDQYNLTLVEVLPAGPGAAVPPTTTYSISGLITNGPGSAVSLTQGTTTIATTAADSGGNYGFSGVANGTYTVTPSSSGIAFTPSSQSVTVNGSPVGGVNFSANTSPGYAISGTISNGGGASVTLSGTATANASADPSGSFIFGGVPNGAYTVTPSMAGFNMWPASQSVNVNNASVPGVNFTALAGLATDVVAYGDGTSASTSVTTNTFSTASPNELLLAFIASDASASGMTVTGVTGGGVTWSLVRRTNAQMGTSEVWRAFATSQLSSASVTATLAQSVVASITVVTFTGADTSSSNGLGAIGATASASAGSGAPTASLVTTRNNSWVFGVGNDYTSPTARTPGAGQILVHQLLSTSGDTYWVQQQNNTTPLQGTTVTINDIAPTGDSYNLTAVEVLPLAGAYGISGSLTTLGGGAAVALSGAASAVAIADSSGNFVFSGLANGSYTVTPSASSVSFSPPSQPAVINGNSVSGVNFGASLLTWSISGSLNPGSSGAGAAVTLGGAGNSSVFADNSGNYTFTGLTNGTYTVTPAKTGYSFTPTVQSETINNASITNASFTVSSTTSSSVSISISPKSASISTNGTQPFTATVAGNSNTSVTWTATGGKVSSSGLYTAPGTAGTYTVTATAAADKTKSASATVTVTAPTSSTVLLGDANVEGQTDSSLALGQAEAFQTTASANGSVQTLAVYLDPASTVGQLVAGVYADSGGHPSALLNQGSITSVVAGAWNPISLPATSVAAGTPYWIAILGTASGSLVFRDAGGGTCSSETSALNSLTSLPSAWTTGTATTTCPASVFGDASKVVFYDTFAGTKLSSNWTVISRHGEYSQDETECNVPSMVSVNNGLTITTEAQSASCGDYFTSASSWPYITGDVQWTNLNFTTGSVEIQAQFPSVNTRLWPATWLLTSSCQYTNPLTGSTGITINGNKCPDIGQSGYHEVDMTECYTSSGWCQFHVANPSFGIGGGCDVEGGSYTVDTNWHVYTTVWTSTSIAQYMDGKLITTCNQKITTPMFLIIQTQTGGVGGTPNSTYLPAMLNVQHVKVTQP